MLRSIAIAAALSFSVFACAASSSSTNDDGSSADQAATAAAPSCGAQYNVALADYKLAVATAKQHKISACEGVNGGDDGAYLSTIAQHAAAANKTCGSFENVIKTSPWAQPIRDELKGNLVLPLLTGDLQVKDASGNVVFKGLQAAFDGNITMWGPGAGLVANRSKIQFQANGKAIISTLKVADDGTQTWTDFQGTYTIGAISGDGIAIHMTSNGGSADYVLKQVDDNGAPDFTLTPVGTTGDIMTAYISECEA
jgi:hypothetical protein